MRLNTEEIAAIETSFAETFGKGEVFLFGSRTDDRRRGGDIDLYVVPETRTDLTQKKIDFLVGLKRRIGEQKIDVVIDRGKARPIDAIARKTGVLLCRR